MEPWRSSLTGTRQWRVEKRLLFLQTPIRKHLTAATRTIQTEDTASECNMKNKPKISILLQQISITGRDLTQYLKSNAEHQKVRLRLCCFRITRANLSLTRHRRSTNLEVRDEPDDVNP
ncbi:hypothetical protein BHE74_00013695 [Ensete ventricosum]|nr:hypothetical protein BHE74_00013695 [Ensete ventricosum]